MSFSFNGIPNAQVSITGGVMPDYSNVTNVLRYNAAGAGTYTVPAGKVWEIIGAVATYNTGDSYVRVINGNYLASQTTSATTARNTFQGVEKIGAGVVVEVGRTGSFSYIEVDA